MDRPVDQRCLVMRERSVKMLRIRRLAGASKPSPHLLDLAREVHLPALLEGSLLHESVGIPLTRYGGLKAPSPELPENARYRARLLGIRVSVPRC